MPEATLRNVDARPVRSEGGHRAARRAAGRPPAGSGEEACSAPSPLFFPLLLRARSRARRAQVPGTVVPWVVQDRSHSPAAHWRSCARSSSAARRCCRTRAHQDEPLPSGARQRRSGPAKSPSPRSRTAAACGRRPEAPAENHGRRRHPLHAHLHRGGEAHGLPVQAVSSPRRPIRSPGAARSGSGGGRG